MQGNDFSEMVLDFPISDLSGQLFEQHRRARNTNFPQREALRPAQTVNPIERVTIKLQHPQRNKPRTKTPANI